MRAIGSTAPLRIGGTRMAILCRICVRMHGSLSAIASADAPFATLIIGAEQRGELTAMREGRFHFVLVFPQIYSARFMFRVLVAQRPIERPSADNNAPEIAAMPIDRIGRRLTDTITLSMPPSISAAESMRTGKSV